MKVCRCSGQVVRSGNGNKLMNGGALRRRASRNQTEATFICPQSPSSQCNQFAIFVWGGSKREKKMVIFSFFWFFKNSIYVGFAPTPKPTPTPQAESGLSTCWWRRNVAVIAVRYAVNKRA